MAQSSTIVDVKQNKGVATRNHPVILDDKRAIAQLIEDG